MSKRRTAALRTRRPLIGFWITCARKNRNYLPSRSWRHPPEPRRARCLFSRGRARGSRTRFFIDQAAGTPTDWYRFLWATAWKRPQKICKWTHASEISAHPAAIERSIPAEQRDSGKEFFHYMPFVLLILWPTSFRWRWVLSQLLQPRVMRPLLQDYSSVG